MKKIKTEYAGKDGWSRWVQPIKKGYKMCCCDCGLVHFMDFRIVYGRVQFKAKRSIRYTKSERRKMEGRRRK
jgi:hypothetical protein